MAKYTIDSAIMFIVLMIPIIRLYFRVLRDVWSKYQTDFSANQHL